MIAETALTRLRVCTDSSDHSLHVDGISTNISDIMRKQVSKISDVKELKSLVSEEFNELLNASVITKMPSFDKVMPHDQMHQLVKNTDFHTFVIR